MRAEKIEQLIKENEFVRRAYELSRKMHEGQKRKSGESFFQHPLMVAEYISKWGLDQASIAAGLLHDIVEDTGGTVTAGVEEYGVAVTSDASWTEAGNFTDDDTPIPAGPATVATTAAPIAASGDDVTITHRVAVSSATKALTYSHIVTWTATANF